MKMIRSMIGLAIILAMTVSCTTTIDPDENLLGDWDVVKVKGRQITNGVPGIVLTDDAPTGYMRFDSDGRGEQNYSFTLFNAVYPFNSSFLWTSTNEEIQIKLILEPDMIWRREINEPDVQQATYDIVVNPTLTFEYTVTLNRQ